MLLRLIRKKRQEIWLVWKFAVPLHRFLGDSLAQQVEHIPFKDGVVGSSPTRITMRERSPYEGCVCRF